MSTYGLWLVFEKTDGAFQKVLEQLNQEGKVNPWSRPQISLRQQEGAAVLTLAEPAKVLGQRIETGQKIWAISSAPEAEVRFFDNKLFYTSDGACYTVRCETPAGKTAAPYSRRFLSIESSVGVPRDASTETRLDPRSPDNPDLWLEPQYLEVPESRVEFEFGPHGGLRALENSFFLPPIRVWDDIDDELPPESYFDPRLVDLRRNLLGLLGQQDPYTDPAGLSMVRFCDEPILRDFLEDGGTLELTGKEGKQTSFNLLVAEHGDCASAYRALTILSPEQVPGPRWAQELAAAFRNDIENLLPGARLKVLPGGKSQTWGVAVKPEVSTDGLYSPGDWHHLKTIHDKLRGSGVSESIFFDRILDPSSASTGQAHPDHGMAMRLFMNYAWRCPWDYTPLPQDPPMDAWKEALREMMQAEFLGQLLSAADRTDRWNRERNPDHGADDPSEPIPRPPDNFTWGTVSDEVEAEKSPVFVLKYMGKPNPDEVIRWRLLLPWRSIVNARTIILGRPGRSKLDGTFVLA